VTAVAGAFRSVARVDSRAEAVRRVAVAALLTFGLVAIAVSAWSLDDGGIGWDSRGDTHAALIVRSIDSSSTLEEAYDAVPATNEFYGVLPQQLGDVLHDGDRVEIYRPLLVDPKEARRYRAELRRKRKGETNG
jgi:putative ubiquitin-RnfH superfamily antitoxin RatB of RatAB toxin-antitoxin module